MEYVHSLYRGDRYRIVSRLSLAAHHGRTARDAPDDFTQGIPDISRTAALWGTVE